MASRARAQHSLWSRRGRRAYLRGQREDALTAYQSALEAADSTGDAALIQRAFCDVSSALLELGRPREAESGLRQIILRPHHPEAGWQATFNLAVALRRQGRLERAKRFADRALDAAQQLRAPRLVARSFNLLGNLALVDSHLDEALHHYRRALSLYCNCRGDYRRSISVLRDNLGYCLVLKQEYREGLKEIRTARAVAREISEPRVEAECLQDECYGLLRQKHLAKAETCGKRALRLAERHSYRDLRVNCYYLLGEIRHLRDDGAGRDVYFLKLQDMYPNLPFLRDFLCAFDVSGIINLKSL
jgi:tetratricopeptide (TPR) repeat protein